MTRSARRRALAVVAVVTVLVASTPAWGHVTRRVGPLRVEVGWAAEPAYAGSANAAQLRLEDASGDPVRRARLSIELFFGSAEEGPSSGPLDLAPVADEPGEYRAFVIPTRPGTYAFRVTGRAAGVEIDETFTSGDDTFDDVRSPAEAEFPAQDPTRGELAERLERIDERIARLDTRLGSGRQAGGGVAAMALGALGLVFGLLALAVATSERRRSRSR